jgi:hypothetical protein
METYANGQDFRTGREALSKKIREFFPSGELKLLSGEKPGKFRSVKILSAMHEDNEVAKALRAVEMRPVSTMNIFKWGNARSKLEAIVTYLRSHGDFDAGYEHSLKVPACGRSDAAYRYLRGNPSALPAARVTPEPQRPTQGQAMQPQHAKMEMQLIPDTEPEPPEENPPPGEATGDNEYLKKLGSTSPMLSNAILNKNKRMDDQNELNGFAANLKRPAAKK